MARTLVLLLMLSFCGTGSLQHAFAEEGDPLVALIQELAPPPSDKALAEIPDTGRKLLALRSYVRAGPKLANRWSWTEAEIKAFQGSDEQLALLAEVDAVKAHFAEANPGYQIYANTKVRSLDKQIRNWNGNESVGVAGEEILTAWTEKFDADLQASGSPDPQKVRIWLMRFRATQRPWIAAPGLTLHGRASAIDFQIMQNGVIIAGANPKQIEPVWQAEGWAAKLKASMAAAGPSFSGPLEKPNEPWHYTYNPSKKPQKADEDSDG